MTLANPRAEALLGETIVVGESLPGREGVAAELVRWVDLYFRDGLTEGNTELQMGARRIRLRARRIPGEEPPGGAVLSLEDVTDELRSERVLAWGEMARQVAHEVKNPLTPMKLSVQHLQRAWEDGRPDFGEILHRNVEVVLREIDRLAAIARSFSRFAAPESAAQTPLEPVSIHRVAEEVMNLYRGGTGALAFRCTVSPDVPPVRSREAELREVLINLLAEWNVAGFRLPGLTGVWTQPAGSVLPAKIAAIGVKVDRFGITRHGFALNLDPDMTYFDGIIACGLAGHPLTSLSAHLPEPPSAEALAPQAARAFGEAFGYESLAFRTGLPG